MNWPFHHQLLQVPLLVALAVTSARSELLEPSALKDCQVHVIGTYQAENDNVDDRIFVQIKSTGHPMVIVLTGYFGSQWNMAIDEPADVRQVIVAGYFEHSVKGVPDSIPIELRYFDKEQPSRAKSNEYFWAYGWHTAEGRKLREKVEAITGTTITTFQGVYAGKRFVIDGKRGRIVDGEPLNTVADDKQKAAENVTASDKTLIETLRLDAARAKRQRSQMTTKLGENHPAVTQLDQSLAQLSETLKRLGENPLSTEDNPPLTGDEDNDAPSLDERRMVERLVRQAFELETQLQRARVQRAEEELQRVKVQLERRVAAADAIVERQVKAILKDEGDTVENPDSTESVALLSTEGWQAWGKQDFRTALNRFERALKQNSEHEASLNGMGWTMIHLGEHEKALQSFRQLLVKQPQHPGALNGLGVCLRATGKVDEAEQAFLNATEAAIAQFGEADAVRSGVTASWFGLVNTYLAEGKYAQASQWAERYLKHKPDDAAMKALAEQAKAKQ